MLKRDGEDSIIGFVIGLAVVVFIIYVIVVLAAAIVGVAAAGGTLFGGCSAIKNYALSFKENVIDSNKTSVVA